MTRFLDVGSASGSDASDTTSVSHPPEAPDFNRCDQRQCTELVIGTEQYRVSVRKPCSRLPFYLSV